MIHAAAELVGGRELGAAIDDMLVGGDGNVVARFAPTVEPNDEALVAAIAGLLAD